MKIYSSLFIMLVALMVFSRPVLSADKSSNKNWWAGTWYLTTTDETLNCPEAKLTQTSAQMSFCNGGTKVPLKVTDGLPNFKCDQYRGKKNKYFWLQKIDQRSLLVGEGVSKLDIHWRMPLGTLYRNRMKCNTERRYHN